MVRIHSHQALWLIHGEAVAENAQDPDSDSNNAAMSTTASDFLQPIKKHGDKNDDMEIS